ncbi:methyl-accepting chemotaxis protein [Pontibacillus marinus]|uniref:Methyl-accepting chemotaxis protein n=1 Tax=Pontibacillus marinus BH030004 = DSM 16465 TaxID=1385511 RepID=A0A0A5GDB2_9BACI|nr:methyl-accepting chemotaxis protein [Pontibacillus marinus]KGX91211.1 methyl-accepting chemotaxis protein [Pontibacillus marinus BH030004 = DSM 16465]
MKLFKSIRAKMMVAMTVLLLLPISILGFIFYNNTSILGQAIIPKEVLEENSDKVKEVFQEHEKMLSSIGKSSEMDYKNYEFSNEVENSISNMPSVNDPQKTEFYEDHLNNLASESDYIINLYLATAEKGEFYLSNIPPEEVNLNKFDPRQREWYTQAMEADGKVIYTEPYRDTGTGKSTITLAKTVTKNGEVIGVLGMDFSMYKLSGLIRDGVKTNTLIIAGVALLVALSFVFFYITRISKNLNRVNEGMANVANGDLSMETLEVKSNDEIGRLAGSYNAMVISLKELVSNVLETSEQVAASSEQLSANAAETSTASEQIAGSIQNVSSGAEDQSSKVEESSELVRTIYDDIGKIHRVVDQVHESSMETANQASDGKENIQQAIEQMSIISENTGNTGKVIASLNEKSNEIGSIVSLITDIAEQTNLLALNAAIEAARAGEHGKGFAVVADEVRKLAEQSNNSAQEISGLIKDIQVSTEDAVTSMGEGEQAVKEGLDVVNYAGQTFEKIHQSITDIANQMSEVSNSVETINSGTENLTNAMDTITSITQEASGATQEVASAAEEQNASMEEVSGATQQLAEQAQELQGMASKFRM